MPRILFRKLTFRQDFLITLLNGIGILIGVFLLNGYVARIHGLDTLGEFLLVRRTSYALVGVSLLGMNIGLPNFIAREQDERFGDNALLTFVIFTIPFLVIFAMLVYWNLIPGFNPAYAEVFSLFVLGVSSQYLTYGLFRGHMNMIAANLLQLISSAIIPFCIFFLITGIENILRVIAIGILIVSISTFLIKNNGWNISKISKQRLKQIWKYGFERIPSFISQFFLLAGVPLLVVSDVSFSDISYLNSTISLVRLFLVFVGPLGIILLPRISQALAQGKITKVKWGIEMLLTWIFFGGLLLSISLSLFGPEILKLWLGNVSVNGAWTARVMLIALPFYAVVGVLRSPIDAASERGYNSIIYSVAAVLLLTSFFLMKSTGISVLKAGVISFLIGYIAAALFSLLIAYRLLNIQPFHMSLLIHMIAGCLLVAVGYNIVIRIQLQHTIQIIVYFLSLLILFLIFVSKSKSKWVIEFRKHALGLK